MNEMHTLIKRIPQEKLEIYLQHGWVRREAPLFARPVEGTTFVEHPYADGNAYDNTEFLKPKSMHLIQRAEIKRPMNAYRGAPFSKAVNFDYMGAAEFEFGALPRSLNAIRYQLFDFNMHKVESVVRQLDGHQYALRLFTSFSGADLEDYIEQLKKLQAGELEHLLHERSHFCIKDRRPDRTDFWWDIENHCMWSYDRQFMKRLPSHLEASFNQMR